MRVTTQVKVAYRMARRLMASGKMGDELVNSLQRGMDDSHISLSTREASTLDTLIKREYGILGQAMHDPNLFKDCRTAARAKQISPKRDLLILTTTTSRCAGCTYKREATCGLMGGRLVSKPMDITEGDVGRTAALLNAEDMLNAKTTRTIRTAEKATPATKLAALHIASHTQVIPADEVLKAEQSSRRASAMLQQRGKMRATPRVATGPSKPLNKDTNDFFLASVEDSAAEAESSRTASMLSTPPLAVKAPMQQEYGRVAISACHMVDDLPVDKRRIAGKKYHDQEAADQAQRALNRTMSEAAKAFSQGLVNTRIAGRIVQARDLALENGAVLPKKFAGISHQLDSMLGEFV